MTKSSTLGVRFGLVAIGSVLALGFLLPPGSAQPGRPPIGGGFGGAPPGGIGGRPPGGISGISGIGGMPGGNIGGRPPGSITGMPAGITGITGIGGAGIHGIHGISGISGTGIHGISGISGAGFSGIGGAGGLNRNEWVCSGCQYVVGTGPVKPLVSNCPRCNAKFSNGFAPGISTPAMPGGFGGGPSVPPPLTPPGGISTPPLNPGTTVTPGGFGGNPGTAPPLPTNPAAGGASPPAQTNPAPSAPAPSAAPDTTSNPAPDESSSSGGKGKTLKLIGIVCGGILLIAALAIMGLVVANASAANKPVKRPRRRVAEDD